MVGVIAGIGLGLERGSANVLGGNGLLGSPVDGVSGEQVYINAASGNLIDTRVDQILAGVGLDAIISETYNSLGAYNPSLGSNDGWMGSYQRAITGLTGTVNTAGSTITHTAADGSKVIYSYQTSGRYAGEYLANEDGGSYDTVTFNAGLNRWIWTDGKSGVRESYDAANGGGLIGTVRSRSVTRPLFHTNRE